MVYNPAAEQQFSASAQLSNTRVYSRNRIVKRILGSFPWEPAQSLSHNNFEGLFECRDAILVEEATKSH